MYVYKYVYNNPIRAGLCNFAELYPYSTLAFRCGEIVESPPVNPSSFLSKLALGGDIEEELALLNDHFNEEEISLVRKAIRKREFSLD